MYTDYKNITYKLVNSNDNYELFGGKKKRHKSPKLKRVESNETINSPDIVEINTCVFEPNYVEHLSEPWFTLISIGMKVFEGRKNKGRFKEMQIGDIVKWYNDDFDHREILTKIVDKYEYDTFKKYLTDLTLKKCLPGIKSLDIGLSVYYKYFTKEDEQKYGVVAIKLELIEC
jgi:ASC-1-like (ASCH) protein